MTDQSRRDFLKAAGITAAAGLFPASNALAGDAPSSTGTVHVPFDLGIASYTFRSFTLDQTIEMTKRLGLKKLTLKDMHLPLKSTDQEIKTALEKMKGAGVELSSCGVVYMKTERRSTTHSRMRRRRDSGCWLAFPSNRCWSSPNAR